MSSFIRRSSFVSATALALAVAGAYFARPAHGQQATPPAAPATLGTVRVAIANPAYIFNNMAETKALQAQMKQQQQEFEQAQHGKVADIEDMKSRRDTLDPNAQQWTDLNSDLSKKVVEYKVWAETQKAMAESTQKNKMRQLFKKIEDTVGEVAKRDGIDLVIADNREPLPSGLDDIDVRTLRGLLLSREVIYSGSQVDITQTVLTLMDARYRGLAGANR